MSTATPSSAATGAARTAPAGAQAPRNPAPAQATSNPAPAKPAPEEESTEYVEPGSSMIDFNMLASGLVSGAVHFVVVLMMALLFIDTKKDTTVTTVVAKAAEEVEDIENEIIEEKIQLKLDTEMTPTTSSDIASVAMQDVVETMDNSINPTTDTDAVAISVELSDFGEKTAPKNDLMSSVGAVTGSGLSGRGAAQKGAMLKAAGGNDASEAAVAAALEWFANHQSADGGWNFDHRDGGTCAGKCSEPGSLKDCRTGATAMALLPFLGAGQTHREGKYKRTVERGLYFLTSQIKIHNGNMGDLAQGGGSMYSHGLASIVLCEAYAMTHDKALMAPAQMAINHIVYAQDPVGGGWRYQPRQPGDTSAVGWQLMALKSGHLAYLQVPPRTIQGAIKFLDSVQIESGAKYGYTNPGAGQATTAVGLLCRMYLGWKKDHPGIERGAEYLSNTGPSRGNMYYNYYATQVMRHYEGEKWDKWNKVMRDQLIETQEKNGHQKGSWFVKGDHGAETGGRIYVTSMSTMILEVYYRHMPIYGKAAAQDEFPL